MSNPQPFTPAASATLTVTTTTANVALPGGAGTRYMLQNEGTATIYFVTGSSAVVATVAGGTPLLGGINKVFTLDPNATNIAGICKNTGETGFLHITQGEGH